MLHSLYQLFFHYLLIIDYNKITKKIIRLVMGNTFIHIITLVINSHYNRDQLTISEVGTINEYLVGLKKRYGMLSGDVFNIIQFIKCFITLYSVHFQLLGSHYDCASFDCFIYLNSNNNTWKNSPLYSTISYIIAIRIIIIRHFN